MSPTSRSLRERDLVFIDTETSGLDPLEHEVLDIAALRLTPDMQTLVARYEQKCVMQWPERASKEALAVNRYDPVVWALARAAPMREALFGLFRLFDDTVLVVGQNPQFDWAFLREACRREAMPLPRTKYLIDVAAIAWPLAMQGKLEKVSLETLCSHFGISNEGAHGAMVDVVRTARCYARLLDLPAPLGGLL